MAAPVAWWAVVVAFGRKEGSRVLRVGVAGLALLGLSCTKVEAMQFHLAEVFAVPVSPAMPIRAATRDPRQPHPPCGS